MNRLETWLLHISTITVTVTGLLYFYMDRFLKPADPFSVINHPAQPYLVKIHIFTAPLLVLVVGLIAHSHILLKLDSGAATGRTSGIYLIFLFLLMMFSGYSLQVFEGKWRPILVWTHLISGVVWALSYLSHQISSYKIRKRRNGNRILL